MDVVANLIDHLHLFPEIDTSRLGSLGWSRGGLEIYKLLTKTNKLKAVAVGGAGGGRGTEALAMDGGLVDCLAQRALPPSVRLDECLRHSDADALSQ